MVYHFGPFSLDSRSFCLLRDKALVPLRGSTGLKVSSAGIADHVWSIEEIVGLLERTADNDD